MKIRVSKRESEGFALLLVLSFTGVGLLALAGLLAWTNNVAQRTERTHQFYKTQAAAEASNEKVLANIKRDFQTNGFAGVDEKLQNYTTMGPSETEDAVWKDLKLKAGGAGLTVTKLGTEKFTNVNTKYTGLKGVATTYRVTTTMQQTGGMTNMVAGLAQDIQLAEVPVFQMGVFYSMDMEFGNYDDFDLSGRVHANGNMYVYPKGALNFLGHVTASGDILTQPSPLDPSYHALGKITYSGESDGGVNTFNLPLGEKNTPDALHSLIDIPPAGEPTNSAKGKLRFYNQAQMIIRVTNTNIVATSGAYNGFATTIPAAQIANFLNPNVIFYDARENKMAWVSEIDISKLNLSMSYLTSVLGQPLTILYIADLRTPSLTWMPAVRLTKGQTLPGTGMTFVTPNPLYVLGHFNVSPSEIGMSTTTYSLRGAVACDALTILSSGWVDNASGDWVYNRIAKPTTFNAGVITGITKTQSGFFSGGVDNAIRYLENWYTKQVNFNGSLACLFYSTKATAPWGSDNVYLAPKKVFRFDTDFNDNTKLPYGTPVFRSVFRNQWRAQGPN